MMLGMGLMGLLWIVLLGAAVWAVVGALNPSRTRTTTGTARDALDTRLARGELSIEEYKTLREALG